MPKYSVYSVVKANDPTFAKALKTFDPAVKSANEVDDKFIDDAAINKKNAVITTGNAAIDAANKKTIDNDANALKMQLKQYYDKHPSPQMKLDDWTAEIDRLKDKRKVEKNKKFDSFDFAATHIGNWFIKGLLTFIQVGLLMGTMAQQSNKVRKELNDIDKLIAEAEKEASDLKAEIAATAALTQSTPNEDQSTEFAGGPGRLAPDGARIDAPHSSSSGQLDESSDDESDDEQHRFRSLTHRSDSDSDG